MLNDKAIAEHYLHGELLEAIQAAIVKLGKTVDSVTIEDLAPVDEFHVGGRLATEDFIAQLNFSERKHILDVGCGLGGAARFIASKYNSHVTGIDIAQEYIETGKELCMWVKLDKLITLQHGSAISLPFRDASFDGGYMLHVGMNIEDKTRLFSEINRVLKPGASFGIYDIMKIKDGEIAFPVPWAKDHKTNKLAQPNEYRRILGETGFEVIKENNRKDFALDYFKQLRAKTLANGGPPPLGLHTLMKESTPIKLKNMIDNFAADFIAPVEIIANKNY